jgi:DNA-binding transcriptional LysR family regulator
MAELDLNLLRVFDTLIELRSVTRAADRLGLTQSAVSHALGRLRAAVDDPLFVRSPSGLQPTARAEEMALGVREGLGRLRSALEPSSFDPATAVRRFTIAAGSYFCSMIMPAVVGRIGRLAPSVSLGMVPVNDHLARSLDRGEVDLALGSFGKVAQRFALTQLGTEEIVWIAATGHPLAGRPFDEERVRTHPQLHISVRAWYHGSDVAAPADGLQFASITAASRFDPQPAEGGIHVYDIFTALAVVEQTDLVALVPRRVVRQTQRRITILGEPNDRTRIALSMLWHQKQRDDPGLAWLRGLIVEAGI